MARAVKKPAAKKAVKKPAAKDIRRNNKRDSQGTIKQRN
jgi:hypothetical protein